MNITIHNAILKTLSYFDFFRYPITKAELWKYLPINSNSTDFEQAVEELIELNIISCIDGYYALHGSRALVERRIKGNNYARKQLLKANRIARFLGNFPFVESVCISGSLSKDFSLPDGDLDFFIITAPNRLWIARTFMHIFKKFTFLVGAQHSFCMNYYVSIEHLTIEPKNIFTAVEVSTLKPAFVRTGLKSLIEHNHNWIKVFIPNYVYNDNHNDYRHSKLLPARLFENLLDIAGGTRLNNLLFNFTKRKWINKWERKGYDINACLTCMDIHFNAPLNHPKNLPGIVIQHYHDTYEKAVTLYKEKQSTYM